MDGKDIVQDSREYAIEEAIPMSERNYGFLDMMFTWLGANAQPSVWWLGGVIAGMGIFSAFVVNILGTVIGALTVALVGFIGFRMGTTTAGVIRVPLGINGSKLLSILNAVTNIGFCGFAHYMGAITISYLLNMSLGTPVAGEPGSEPVMAIGILVIGTLSMIFVSVEGSKSIKIVERILSIGLIILSSWMTIVVVRSFDLTAIANWRPSAEQFVPFGVGFDMIFAGMLAWVLSSCEFTRYTKTRAAATGAPAIGLSIAGIWFIGVGILTVIAVASSTGVYDPNLSDPSTTAASLGLGWVALLVILFTTITSNLVCIYTAAFSVMNISRNVRFMPASLVSGILTLIVGLIPVFVFSFYDSFMIFLDFISGSFPPLIAIVICDYYLVRKGDYRMEYIAEKNGPYWYTNGVNWMTAVLWAAGVIFYIITKNVGVFSETTGAVIPTFVLTGVVYTLVAKKRWNHG
ncbi:cytosine permease [uncultured Dysosmobacter sp.]|uniref:cytosine permease n=1 Tax=uncultured Dysosmobacter sp. TaxID=2591384 RepID=UPI00260C828E|nr:cytosine permease [uncultured Dysosmobacter sp.]